MIVLCSLRWIYLLLRFYCMWSTADGDHSLDTNGEFVGDLPTGRHRGAPASLRAAAPSSHGAAPSGHGADPHAGDPNHGGGAVVSVTEHRLVAIGHKYLVHRFDGPQSRVPVRQSDRVRQRADGVPVVQRVRGARGCRPPSGVGATLAVAGLRLARRLPSTLHNTTGTTTLRTFNF